MASVVATSHPPRGWLWFGVLAAPCAWAVQELAGWYLAGSPCKPHAAARALDGGAFWLQVALHALAIIVALAALVCGLRIWRRTPADGDQAVPVDRFLATIAIVVSLVGLGALVWGSLGTFMLPACESLR